MGTLLCNRAQGVGSEDHRGKSFASTIGMACLQAFISKASEAPKASEASEAPEASESPEASKAPTPE